MQNALIIYIALDSSFLCTLIRVYKQTLSQALHGDGEAWDDQSGPPVLCWVCRLRLRGGHTSCHRGGIPWCGHPGLQVSNVRGLARYSVYLTATALTKLLYHLLYMVDHPHRLKKLKLTNDLKYFFNLQLNMQYVKI